MKLMLLGVVALVLPLLAEGGLTYEGRGNFLEFRRAEP